MASFADTVMGRVAAGDASAMEECLARYGGLVWSLARRFSPSSADAEDAVQEIFIEVWRYAARYDESIASEPTFVAMIARRRLIDGQRRRGRQPVSSTFEESALPSSAPSRDDADWLAICEDAARARESMRQLSDEQQRVLQLAIDGDYSQSEIAQRLNLPLGTVKTHARRGLIRLRELMGATVGAATKGGAS